MKKISFLILATILLSMEIIAQTANERIYIKGGNDAWDNLMLQVYRYPAFEQGIVEYKNGKQYKSTFNYNKILATIQFIDEKNDTLSMSNEETISRILVGNDVYFYSPECMQELRDNGVIKLAKTERVKIADDNPKTGGYGQPNTTGTIETVTKILHTRIDYNNKNDINETLLLSKTTHFYIEAGNNELIPASKKNILNLFPKHETEIREYIKTKQIDFSKEDDLVELTGYLSQL